MLSVSSTLVSLFLIAFICFIFGFQHQCFIQPGLNLILFHQLHPSIMMGIPFNLLQKNSDANQLIRVLTIAIRMTN